MNIFKTVEKSTTLKVLQSIHILNICKYTVQFQFFWEKYLWEILGSLIKNMHVHIWYFEITFSTDYIKSALYNGLDAIIKCSLIAQLHALGKRGPLGQF